MKRKNKQKDEIRKKAIKSTTADVAVISSAPKTLAERLGISPEILLGEPKITVTGDYMVEIVNHKGIISLSDEKIEVNTRKYIYKIVGSSLMITALTDEELTISGNVNIIEKE